MSKTKLHICYDRLPADEAQTIAWAELAREINPQNAPQHPIVLAGILASVCMSGARETDPADCDLAEYFTPLEMALLTAKKWQAAQEITFGFLRASAQIAAHARDAVAAIQPHVNLRFRETNASAAMIRIADYEQGAYAFLGTDALGVSKNQQTMNLARSWADLGTAIHEWCHALGMIHEHQSPAAPADLWNEAAVYRYYAGPPNNWSRQQISSNVIQRYGSSQTQFTEWDRKSIMLYPLARELVQRAEYVTGWNKELSDTDKAFLSKTYPGSVQPPPDLLEINVPRAGKWVWQGASGA